jgi:hypothetical protein
VAILYIFVFSSNLNYSLKNISVNNKGFYGALILSSCLFLKCFLSKILRYSQRPIKTLRKFGDIAQLARAPALQAGGPGFESPCLHHFLACGAIAQLVRARH